MIRPLVRSLMWPALAALLALALRANAVAAADSVPKLEPVDAAGLRARVAASPAQATLLVYWATWCGPCREEIPLFKALRREYPADRLLILGVSVDLDRQALAAFLGSHPLGYPTLYGGEKLMEELSLRAIPRTELYGPDKTLRKAYPGRVDARTLRRDIAAALAGEVLP